MASLRCNRQRGRHAWAAVALLQLGAARAAGEIALLKFSNVTVSNLGGRGPELKGLQGLRYNDVADLGAERVDGIFKVNGDVSQYIPDQVEHNGKRGEFGVVNLRQDSVADLQFRIFDHTSTNFVTEKEFYFTIHDIDSIDDDSKERVLVEGFQTYCGSHDSDVAFEQQGNAMQLTSTEVGDKDDDPKSPWDLSPSQKRRSVTFTFRNVKEFHVVFELEGIQGDGGRDVLFSGVPLECAVKDKWRCEEDLAHEAEWSKEQVEWCCKTKKLGCGDEGLGSISSFECEGEASDWKKDELDWCCKYKGRGCDDKHNAPHDCQEGLWNWKHGWSEEKMSWCCTHEELGCAEDEKPPPETYDCQPGNINPVRHWTEQKRQWCCEHTGQGCLVVDDAKLKGIPPVQHCQGQETHWVRCEDQPKCPSCSPQHCIFSEWSDWSIGDNACTGLCERRRSILQASNSCGNPCNGSQVQTLASKDCYGEDCGGHYSQDCTWDEWEEWSTCFSETSQSHRTRSVRVHPSLDGVPCQGEWNQTRACGDDSRDIDCELSEWGNWTECTRTCGGGTKAQMREIVKRASHGGKPCSGVVRRSAECNTQPCSDGGERCELSDWAQWSGCQPHQGILQQTRVRTVQKIDQDAGDQSFCNNVLSETRECSDQPSVAFECDLPEWSEWSECSAACSGHRHRSRLTSEFHSSHCYLSEPMAALNETTPCGPSCSAGNNCDLSEWTEWSECSTSCGTGLSERSRSVNSKKSCTDVLKETKECNRGNCTAVDCKWGDWEDWGHCSATCGGGYRKRMRHIDALPEHLGELCKAQSKAEVEPCHTNNCTICVDGEWGDWADWSDCSASCAPAYRSRHRDLAKRANHCGKPATGLGDEFEKCEEVSSCEAQEEYRDCKLSDWEEWSDCSASCAGVRHRHRQVLDGALGKGKPCIGNLHLVEACESPKECYPKEAVNCSMADWSDWTACSASCDGGQRKRHRNLKNYARRGGIGCSNESKAEVGSCGVEPCDPECGPCEFGDWSDWGDCVEGVRKCSSQRYRERKVKTQPGKCGRTCPTGVTKEATNCSLPCDTGYVSYCVWSDWSVNGECQGSCQYATQSRQRELKTVTYKELDLQLEGGEPKEAVFFKLSDGSNCNGTQTETHVCSQDTCGEEQGPQDCEFDEWSRWSDPTCTHLCERHRGIKNPNAEGGKPCRGSVVEAKPCKHDCNDPDADPDDCYFSDYNCTLPVDCLFSDWNGWSECKSKMDQGYRNRTVLQESKRGGKACDGPLLETHSCDDPDVELVDCRLGDWESWSQCSRSCGGGVHERSRKIDVEPKNGGSGCSGPLKQEGVCSPNLCEHDKDEDTPCLLAEWADWSDCNDAGMRGRKRVLQKDARGSGVRCNGVVQEKEKCTGPVDCVVSEWTDWTSCDKSCSGGQKRRTRQILTPAREKGIACPKDLEVMAGCNQVPCHEDDAKVSEWSDWSSCSKECSGERTRQRNVIQPPEGGVAFNGPLIQTEPCGPPEGSHSCNECRECEWGLWSEWSGCDRDCGGGQQSRERSVETAPGKGCPPCEALDKAEVRACNTAPCGADEDSECIDGKWGAWTAWGPCSATCRGGITSRSRSVAVEPNHCGKPVNGLSQEFGSCNDQITCTEDSDCEFTDWTFWSSCEDPCHGTKKRERKIRIEGSGEGEFCDGATGQMAPCREDESCQGKDQDEDCVLSDWSPWSTCDAECGIGQKSRSRDILKEGSSHGRWCNGVLRETFPCNSSKPCEESQCTPVDCSWSEWRDWSLCDHGQKRRTRSIVSYPKCRGKACVTTSAEEIAACKNGLDTETFCVWGDWGRFTDCSTTCGSGLKSRQRKMLLTLRRSDTNVSSDGNSSLEALTRLFSGVHSSEAPADPATLAEGVRQLRLLEARTSALAEQRRGGLALAWAAGACSLLVAWAGRRVLSARSAARHEPLSRAVPS